MHLYAIAVIVRFVSLCGEGPFETYREIDGVGCLIKHDRENLAELTDDLLRGPMQQTEEQCYCIAANTPQEAIEKFYAEWEGASVGGDEYPGQKALWIHPQLSILELPPCERRRISHAKKYPQNLGPWHICTTGDGHPGECLCHGVSGYQPNNCPINKLGMRPITIAINHLWPGAINDLPQREIVGFPFTLISYKDLGKSDE